MVKQIYNILMKKIKLRKNQKNVLAETKVGDMIWCTMPLSKKKLKKIEESHRIRPYLVVEKEKNFLWCYQSSSKNLEEINKILELLIEKNIQNREIEKIYEYVRNLLFSSVV